MKPFSFRTTALALALACTAYPAHADSIVGDWAADPNDCGTQFAYRIAPLALASDTLSCTFDNVSRKGDVVRFTGACDEGQGPRSEVVIAREAGGKLSITFERDGGDLAGLMRCPTPRPGDR